jgi:hypothetical protein
MLGVYKIRKQIEILKTFRSQNNFNISLDERPHRKQIVD